MANLFPDMAIKISVQKLNLKKHLSRVDDLPLVISRLFIIGLASKVETEKLGFINKSFYLPHTFQIITKQK